jgi:hypothetical protein
MVTQQQHAECCRYIRAIRNSKKRRYAIDYYNWRRGQALQPDTANYQLGGMATQAVRMQISEFIGAA